MLVKREGATYFELCCLPINCSSFPVTNVILIFKYSNLTIPDVSQCGNFVPMLRCVVDSVIPRDGGEM